MGIGLGFLGGASAIGASCVHVDLDGFSAVVDAGIRQGRGETLPDLRALQEHLGTASPDVFVLTHAHLDHSGALPVLVRAWPDVPIVTTRATAALVRILLLDSLGIMGLAREEEIPLFSAEEVEATLARIRPVGFDDPVQAGAGRVRLLPAGHILGAGAALLESGARRVLVTGDLSVTDQRTVPGMPPPRVRPEAVVVEATYGARLHASRDAEERRLAERVAAAVEAGGHVLVPAFAVGRAQEVLLLLEAAMAARRIPRFPVHADGMVRTVCDAYRDHPHFLGPRLRKRVLRGEDPFFAARDVSRVTSPEARRRVIEGPPCVVVASSGMLTGGASTVYAKAWARDPTNLVAITGYQDEESPGRALLDLAAGARRELRIDGTRVEVRAQVETYHLSAHADADELVGLLRAVGPRTVYVVHGDAEARRALARRVLEEGIADCVLPEDGDRIEHETYALAPRGRGGAGLSGGRALDEAALGEIRDVLLQVGGARHRLVTAEDVASLWFGGEPGAGDVERARALLEAPRAPFGPDARRPYRYRPLPRTARSGPASVAEVLELLARDLPPGVAGPYSPSTHVATHRVVLRFAFPDVAAARVAPRLADLAAATGWSLEVHPHANQAALAERARAALPEDVACGRVSIRFAEHRVQVEVDGPVADLAARAAAFEEETGWGLACTPAAHGGDPAQAPAAGALRPEEVRDELERAFAGVDPDLRPLRVTFPGGAVVLHFAHPGMARQHEARLRALGERTGRAVRAHPHPNHQRLSALVAGRLPPTWEVLAAPAWVPQREVVRVPVWTLPPATEREAVARRVREALGCEIAVERGD